MNSTTSLNRVARVHGSNSSHGGRDLAGSSGATRSETMFRVGLPIAITPRWCRALPFVEPSGRVWPRGRSILGARCCGRRARLQSGAFGSLGWLSVLLQGMGGSFRRFGEPCSLHEPRRGHGPHGEAGDQTSHQHRSGREALELAPLFRSGRSTLDGLAQARQAIRRDS